VWQFCASTSKRQFINTIDELLLTQGVDTSTSREYRRQTHTRQTETQSEMNTPASFDDLTAQAKEMGFDEVTLILSKSKAPKAFIVRSNVDRQDRLAGIVEAVEQNIVDKMISMLGADAPFARYLNNRRLIGCGKCRPRSRGQGIG
jgi:hypothetical protein